MAFKALKKIKLSKSVYQNMPFIGFLALIAMLYIANAHNGEKTMREIQVLEKEAKEERWRYMSIKSELTQSSQCSNVENQVYDSGLQVAVESPKILIVN